MIRVHLAERVEPLAERLAGVLAEPPADPLAPEWVAVPSEGMRRWLALTLARHLGAGAPGDGDGVAANITFAFTGSLRLRVLEAEQPDAHSDPWRLERLAWAVLDTLDGNAGDPGLGPLLQVPPGGSRYSRARRLADLFDRYHLHRPAMVRAWAAGCDLDSSGGPVPDHQVWQPHLWRLVRRHLGVPSPAERLPELLRRLRDGSLALDLPDRLAVFGITLLPGGSGFVELAEAVAATRELHLFLLEPSPVAATRLRRWARSHPVPWSPPPGWARGGGEGGLPRARTVDRSASVLAHPLLRSWGRLPRETAVLLADAGLVDAGGALLAGGGLEPATVLGRLQRDLREDRVPRADLRPDPSDRSIEIHACHGPTRQVEVLRDAILHCLAEDPGLREDDIVVLCPALERFAPLIGAVFGPSVASRAAGRAQGWSDAGPGEEDGGPAPGDRAPGLRYRIADRSVQTTNPLLAATATLLELLGGRLSVTDVLDFLTLGPVRQRFGLGDDELARVKDWVEETKVRWGLDAGHRARMGVPASITTNTWQAATDRLLVGSAVLAEEPAPALGEVVPLGVEGDDAVLAGRLAELLWRLARLAEEATGARPIGAWVEWLRAAVETLMAASPGAEWQLESLARHLADLVELAGEPDRASAAPLELVDLRRVLADRLRATPGRPDFFRGGITFSSMSPLRSIPHRVVCLLGADQLALGSGGVDGDDLSALVPWFGDRDPRGEVRQSLLEAVLVAGDRLVVVRDGHDVRTNQPVPPAVVVAELRDAVLETVHPDVREVYAGRLELHHPRQPFDERCFVPGGIVAATPWGFDPQALAGATARRQRVGTGPSWWAAGRPFLQRELIRDDSPVIELSSLQRFLRHPVRYFLEQRLHVRLPRGEERTSVLLPVTLGGLDRWEVGERLLRARLRGISVEEWVRTERQLGTLPPAGLGVVAVAELAAQVEQLVGVARRLGVADGPPAILPVDVELSDGTRVVGTVLGQLESDRPGPARLRFGRDRPEHRVAAWLDLMALAAEEPAADWHAVTVGRGTGRLGPVAAELVPRASVSERGAAARAALEVAVDCYRRGSGEPIPLFPRLSHRLYLDQARPADWVGPPQQPGERDDPATALVFGAWDLDELLGLPARPGDPHGPGRRAERFARYLWGAIEASVVDQACGDQASRDQTTGEPAGREPAAAMSESESLGIAV